MLEIALSNNNKDFFVVGNYIVGRTGVPRISLDLREQKNLSTFIFYITVILAVLKNWNLLILMIFAKNYAFIGG